ncbi:MAG: hypothetical protein CL570_07660 [Alphaproteobacteria bacterium]|nr:hypothetical protein [Alphaproteobacteria bacterium]HCQ70601.1 hypothetical protein [Rhodospirillaceae bacterium]
MIIITLSTWQTLISGMLALLAAYLTIRTMNKNHHDLLERKRLAFKGNLHLIATQLCSIYEKHYIEIENALIDEKSAVNISFPEKEIQSLLQGIEFLDNSSAQYIDKFIELNQVFYARLKRNQALGYEKVIDLLELYALVENFFDYSRGETSSLIYQRIKNAKLHSTFRVLEGVQRPLGTARHLNDAYIKKVADTINQLRPT